MSHATLKTVSPISSTRRTDWRGRAAFTLVEVMVSASLSSVLLAGVISSFLMIGRSGVNAQNYTDLEMQTRKALEIFSRDVRMANSVNTGFSSTSVTLGIPDATTNRLSVAYTVTYTFDAAQHAFTRTVNTPGSPTEVLVSNVRQLTGVNPFNYFQYVTTGGYKDGFIDSVTGQIMNTTNNPASVKQIEINFVAQRDQSVTVTTATNRVLSARFILRNK
jgi:Tfp pilus assembly protein PilW